MTALLSEPHSPSIGTATTATLRVARQLYTHTIAGHTVTTTLDEDDLDRLLPDPAVRAEWARRLAGAPRPAPAQLDPARRPAGDWRRRATCRGGIDADAALVDWVPDATNARGRATKAYAANLELAREVCARCPVRRECLDDALAGFPVATSTDRERGKVPMVVGIWAGTDEVERDLVAR